MTQLTSATNSRGVYIALIGPGGVGTHVLTQLFTLIIHPPTPHTLHLIYLANSRASLKSSTYSSLPNNAISQLPTSKTPPLTPSVLQTYLLAAPGPAILIDCTASSTIPSTYPELLRAGISIVTPNKTPFAGPQDLFDTIRAAAGSECLSEFGHRRGWQSHIYYEASAGAGLPLMSTLTELVRTSDEMWMIQGMFSGSLSYLFNAFMPGPNQNDGGNSSGSGSGSQGSRPSWSSLVLHARQEGYTEPDPRADLSGLDVARKLTIISRTLGFAVPDGPLSLPVRGLVPEALKDCSVDEFLSELSEFDDGMEEMRRDAEREGKVWRYVGSVDFRRGEFDVGVRLFDKSHPIATVSGSGKFIEISTKRYGDSTLVIQGGSANLPLTAMSVIGDVIKVLDRLPGFTSGSQR